jgi:hypothetical protein
MPVESYSLGMFESYTLRPIYSKISNDACRWTNSKEPNRQDVKNAKKRVDAAIEPLTQTTVCRLAEEVVCLSAVLNPKLQSSICQR